MTFTKTPDLHTTLPKKQRWYTRRRVLVPAVLFLGLGMGAATNPAPQTVEVAGPERVVEKTVEVPGPERVVTKEVPTEVTPAACLEALDLSEQGFDYSAEAMGYMTDAMNAAASFDIAGIEAATADLQVLNPKIEALTGPMRAAVSSCRAAE